MSTKNDKYSFIEKSFTTSSNRYYNLNLKQSKKCATLISVQSNSKTNNASYNYKEKEKSQLWNKSLKVSNFSPHKKDNSDFKKRWKNGNTFDATNKSILSLNIFAFKNPIASDLFDDENMEGLKKEKFGTIKTSKHYFTDNVKSQNPFEFPRQQERDQRKESEVMRFSPSQRLLDSQHPTADNKILAKKMDSSDTLANVDMNFKDMRTCDGPCKELMYNDQLEYFECSHAICGECLNESTAIEIQNGKFLCPVSTCRHGNAERNISAAKEFTFLKQNYLHSGPNPFIPLTESSCSTPRQVTERLSAYPLNASEYDEKLIAELQALTCETAKPIFNNEEEEDFEDCETAQTFAY